MIKKINKKILNFLDNIYLPVTLQSKQSEISFYWYLGLVTSYYYAIYSVARLNSFWEKRSCFFHSFFRGSQLRR